MTSAPNPVMAPAVPHEYLFCLPSSEWLRPLARQKVRGLLSRSCTLSTMGRWLRPIKSGYTWFPPMANGWVTMHPVLDIAPPLLAEGEGPPT
jgi:hypothetical protein